jgi:GNAT superfamily N-acetyltransferase
MPRQLALAGPDTFSVVPANEASRDDLHAIFGVRGYAAYCQCQRFKIGPHGWTEPTVAERMQRLEQETHCGYPSARRTSGLVAYLDGEPVGWCAVAPRADHARLLRDNRVPWQGRNEDKTDATVWAVTCFVTRAGFRHQGVSRALAAGTVELARDRGARVIEAYPMKPAPGKEVTWGDMHVGALSAFLAAGYRIVHTPSLRRAVVRYDF